MVITVLCIIIVPSAIAARTSLQQFPLEIPSITMNKSIRSFEVYPINIVELYPDTTKSDIRIYDTTARINPTIVNSIYQFDKPTFELVSLNVGSNPNGADVNPNMKIGYVSNGSSDIASIANGKTNSVEPSTDTVILQINPLDSGDIYCNGKQIPSNYVKYYNGTQLKCEAKAHSDFVFNYWSGDLTNPIKFTVSKSGILAANFKMSFAMDFLSIPSGLLLIASFLIILPAILLTIPRYLRIRELNRIKKEIDEVYDHTSDQLKRKERLGEKSIEIMDKLDKGKIDEKHREILFNIILAYIKKTNDSDTKNEENLNSLAKAIEELTTTYNNILLLLGVDFTNVLMRTAQRTNKHIILRDILKSQKTIFGQRFQYYQGYLPLKKNQFDIRATIWMPDTVRYNPGKGSYISIFLFKRRARKLFNAILSTCNFFMLYEEDHTKLSTIQKIIQDVNKSQKYLLARKRIKRLI